MIIANAAKSNGTLICLAGKSIVMGPPSELGPIEPHLNGTPCTILAQPQFAAINYPLHQLAIDALKQTRKLAEMLLKEGMLAGADQLDVDKVVQALGSRDVYFSHGSAIGHKDAAGLGLTIEALVDDDPIWQRIWLLYTMYDFDCRRDGLLKVYEGRGRSTAVLIPPPSPPPPGP